MPARIILLFLLFAAVTGRAQFASVSWSLTPPAIENVDSIFLQVFNENGYRVFADSVPVAGSLANVPVAAATLENAETHLGIRAENNRLLFDIFSATASNAIIGVYNTHGQTVYTHKTQIDAGRNRLSVSPGKLAPGVYLANFSSSSSKKSVKIISGFDGKLSGGTLEDKMSSGNFLKSASGSDSWKYVVSHPKLLTDTFLVAYSPVMFLGGDLESRPTVYLRTVKHIDNKYEYGGIKPANERTPVPGISVEVAGIAYGLTDINGEFTGRIDKRGNARLEAKDLSDFYYSKWFDFDFQPGKFIDVKDFSSDQVDLIKQEKGIFGEDLLEAMWFHHYFSLRSGTNFIGVFVPDSIMKNRGGVFIDPIFKGEKYNNVLSAINQLLKFHLKGVPELFEADSAHSYIHIHYGGTPFDGETRHRYRKNSENLGYVEKVDVYFSKITCDANIEGFIYPLGIHEMLRVYGAHNTIFDKKDIVYVMYIDPITRWWTYGYNPEPTTFERSIFENLVCFNGHPNIHNNFSLSHLMNFPEYPGNPAANTKAPVPGFIPKTSVVTTAQTIKFTDQSTNNPVSWFWDFGDGTTSTEQNPVKSYKSVGLFTVTLTAANGFGSNIEKKKNSIKVIEPVKTDSTSALEYYGYKYKIFKIGTQWWFAQNLRTTKYRNGSKIPNVNSSSSWAALTSAAFCWYNNDSNSFYGSYYNWYAVNNPNNLCPAGWHVATDADWNVLTELLGGEYVAGDKLKEIMFSTTDSGYRNSSGQFIGAGMGYKYFWSSSPLDSLNSWGRNYNNANSSNLSRNSFSNNSGICVRCVKDQ